MWVTSPSVFDRAMSEAKDKTMTTKPENTDFDKWFEEYTDTHDMDGNSWWLEPIMREAYEAGRRREADEAEMFEASFRYP